jgi:hypothetical protein
MDDKGSSMEAVEDDGAESGDSQKHNRPQYICSADVRVDFRLAHFDTPAMTRHFSPRLIQRLSDGLDFVKMVRIA